MAWCDLVVVFPQVLALFNKAIRKLHSHLRAAKEAAIERSLPRAPARGPGGQQQQQLGDGTVEGLDEEMEAAADKVKQQMKQQLSLDKAAHYAIMGEWGVWRGGRRWRGRGGGRSMAGEYNEGCEGCGSFGFRV